MLGLRDHEADGWERSDFPIICEWCSFEISFLYFVLLLSARGVNLVTWSFGLGDFENIHVLTFGLYSGFIY